MITKSVDNLFEDWCLEVKSSDKVNVPTLIVKLSTSYFKSKNGIHSQKTIRTLKRLSSGCYTPIEQECYEVGVQEKIEKIENFHDCDDGIYEVIYVNYYCDHESGCIEDWEYRLIPYKKDVDNSKDSGKV